MKPFGEASCEAEKDILGKDYSKYFFEHAPFNSDSVDPNTYLIVGRRGCGKTSLAEYFKFQHQISDAKCIDVDEPNVYAAVSRKVADLMNYPSEVSIPKVSDIWEYTIWCLIFRLYKDEDNRIKAACVVDGSEKSASSLIKTILSGIISKYVVENGDELIDQIDTILNEKTFKLAKEVVQKITERRPVIVAIDSMDHYSINDQAAMWSIAGLIQCASSFNRKYARSGIHVKLFLTDEIFPHLKERVITNTLKYVRDPLFLLWRPKSLVRLISWRFYKHLSTSYPHLLAYTDIDWDDFDDVHHKMWIPYFGIKVENRNGVREHTFPYILRHTQMRPRQLVVLCNEFAKQAMRCRTFPKCDPNILKEAVWHCELSLADEVINSYSRIYPNISNIILALSGLPMTFKGKELDRVAKRTAAHWQDGKYSLDMFRQIVTEMGIVGRQRSSKDGRSEILEADFEFAMEDRLFIHEQDDCVIHPMFYRKLNTSKQNGTCVYPFPDHPAFKPISEMRKFSGITPHRLPT
jgi:hypothetical protein